MPKKIQQNQILSKLKLNIDSELKQFAKEYKRESDKGERDKHYNPDDALDELKIYHKKKIIKHFDESTKKMLCGSTLSSMLKKFGKRGRKDILEAVKEIQDEELEKSVKKAVDKISKFEKEVDKAIEGIAKEVESYKTEKDSKSFFEKYRTVILKAGAVAIAAGAAFFVAAAMVGIAASAGIVLPGLGLLAGASVIAGGLGMMGGGVSLITGVAASVAGLSAVAVQSVMTPNEFKDIASEKAEILKSFANVAIEKVKELGAEKGQGR
ncbi:hypothetical protein NF27_DP01780 [Candidatus Jidaibacter acanthamoeba]|uniref:Uncharacterized protein n=1 Tax=Candidatus Jidaibacter acanthamoebae TaxID=86105 RepID=A0A0C1QJD5_9RICK|nr:hypothetical protein [Candidatus Jidaibacter acanthamoeba]KIE05634.1 hypothetical protein NF27_DP01780 [Candidatus Jidaibacter acanthamoeba]